MAKTIDLTPKATKWVFIISGIIISIGGIKRSLEIDSMTTWDAIIDITLGLIGLLWIVYGIILFNLKNKLTSKIQIDEMGILIKEAIYKRPTKMMWGNMKAIMFSSYRLDFLLNDNTTKTLKLWRGLSTDENILVEIKKTIREFANDRQIKITEKKYPIELL